MPSAPVPDDAGVARLWRTTDDQAPDAPPPPPLAIPAVNPDAPNYGDPPTDVPEYVQTARFKVYPLAAELTPPPRIRGVGYDPDNRSSGYRYYIDYLDDCPYFKELDDHHSLNLIKVSQSKDYTLPYPTPSRRYWDTTGNNTGDVPMMMWIWAHACRHAAKSRDRMVPLIYQGVTHTPPRFHMKEA